MCISARHWNRLCRAHVGYSLPEPGWLWSMTVTGGWAGGGAVHLGCFTVMILVRSVIGRVAMKGEPSEGESFFLGPVPYSDLPTIRLLWWLSTATETWLPQKRIAQILAYHSSWKLKLSGVSLSISLCRANGLLLPYGSCDTYCSSSLGAKNKLSEKLGV